MEALAGEALGITIPLFHGSDLVQAITIPLFTGAIGYLTNWSGVWMLFYPVRFDGVRMPGLAALVSLLPRKIQQIPGVMQGGVGWQGIIPSRAAKMGSIAVDKGIAKLGSPADFYQQLEPDKIAEHILATSRGDIRDVVERIMEREHPQLWRDLPPRVREAVHARVQEQLPEHRPHRHRRDRRARRSAPGRQADGDPPHRGASPSWPTGSSSRSGAGSCAS